MNSNEINVVSENNGKETNENTMKNLYFKVHDVIKDAKMQKYAVDSCNIHAEGITFLGHFTGRNTLQLESIYACAISDLGGNFTHAMRTTYDEIKSKYGHEDISDEKMYELAANKVTQGQSYLPVIHKERSLGAIFGDTRTQIEYFRLENRKLENEIILERGKSQFGTFDYVGKKAGIIIPTNVKNAKKALTK